MLGSFGKSFVQSFTYNFLQLHLHLEEVNGGLIAIALLLPLTAI